MNTLDAELAMNPAEPEPFMSAFFEVVQPYAVMLREILAMFEAAGAKRTDSNLKIAFNFDKSSAAASADAEPVPARRACLQADHTACVRPAVVPRGHLEALESDTRVAT
jgi:hypothetical protein